MLQTASGVLLAGLPACADWRRKVAASEQRLVSQRHMRIVKWDLSDPDFTSVLRHEAISARRLARSFLVRLDAKMRDVLALSAGVGLAAPQVGLCRRVILVQLQRPGKPVLTLVDPVIQRASGPRVQGYEACLSVDGVGGRVGRAQAVQVSYYDVHGRQRFLSSTGWEARIVQHEVDHLEGVLYLDRLTGPLLTIEEMRRRRRQERARHHAELPGGARRLAWSGEPLAWRDSVEGPCLL